MLGGEYWQARLLRPGSDSRAMHNRSHSVYTLRHYGDPEGRGEPNSSIAWTARPVGPPSAGAAESRLSRRNLTGSRCNCS